MNEPVFTPSRGSRISSEIHRMQQRDRTNQVRRSTGTLTSNTTEGTHVKATAVANWPRSAKAKQARWA